jgi:hypothetical protein
LIDLNLVLKIVQHDSPHYSSEVKQLEIKIQNKKKRKYFTINGKILTEHTISQAPSLAFKFNRYCHVPPIIKGKFNLKSDRKLEKP